ncbi:MAG: type II toxin-antitoxin system RelE/ParE family toxin [Proteobacteria bacterium]|nr:type II toxin-antitoxin system RelE/ParE family toxin [Pseudomonadota bacterium]
MFSLVEVTAQYLAWLEGLQDPTVRARVRVRVDRMVYGNPGHHRVLAGGLVELKFDFGAGYRVYFKVLSPNRLVVLMGGDKKSQRDDILKARLLASSLEAPP